MSQPLIYIVVLNWHGWRDTLECLGTLQKLTYPNFRVLVVDNGSADESVSQIRGAYPLLELLETGANLGFSGGNNRGVRYALEQGAEYVWLLNNDTLVTPQSLTAMVELAEQDITVGAVGSVLYFAERPEQIQSWGGGKINWWLGQTYSLQAPGKLDYLTAASLLVRRATFQKVGLLEEKYFMYWEDVDWSLRCLKNKWKLAVASDARILHKESASAGRYTPNQDFMFSESLVRFLRRHSAIAVVPIFLGSCMRIGKRLLDGNWLRAHSVWRGLVKGWQD